ncbi:MAG: hypothetical protein J0L62_01460 [Bacteroidetes bacterium]|nr:hypothetical protein [Bacteroidota bacterium]
MKTETKLFWGIILAGFLVNLVFIYVHPVVWMDEVCYADPAANLYFGHGWVSTAWYAQNEHEFWAGNVPLYQILLAGWYKLTGFGIFQTRVFSYLLFFATLVLIYFSKPVKQILTDKSLLLLTGLLILEYGISFSYRSARPDAITILLFSAGVIAVFSPGRKWLILILGFLSPIAGLQLLPLNALAGLFILLFFWSQKTKVFLWGAGHATGIAGLYVFYSLNGVWDKFLSSISGHTVASRFNLESFAGSFTDIYTQDPGILVIIIFCGFLLYFIRINKPDLFAGLFLKFCFISFFLPFAILVSGKFPVYYSWMVAVPLLGFSVYLIQTGTTLFNHSIKLSVLFLLSIGLTGLITRLAIAGFEWDSRNYYVVENLPQWEQTEGKRVFTSYQGYYPLMRKSRRVYTQNYFHYQSVFNTLDYLVYDKPMLKLIDFSNLSPTKVDSIAFGQNSLNKKSSSYQLIISEVKGKQ